jgi:glycosyltransferase involved in cell wall biosynthesis
MKRVLMIAFHFPPSSMGSGHLRTLGFVRSLPQSGWEPIVLSVNAAALPRVDARNLELVPAHCRVYRSPALDVRRHLSIRGKYFGFLAQPDGWASWWPMAVMQGRKLIREHHIDAIWSTYPIMTAHCIAYTLSRMSGLPWVADFRDPVAGSVGKENRHSARSQHRWEQRVAGAAAHTVFTTPGAMASYAASYPATAAAGRVSVIPNGYDENLFEDMPEPLARAPGQPLTLLHSGTLYPDGRNPMSFLTALANLKAKGRLGEADLRVVLRASGSEAVYGAELRRLGLERMITLAPPISSREALLEQAGADGLLLFQGRRFDHQIPAKIYEYLRMRRPILALVGPGGDTDTFLRSTGCARIVAMENTAAIEDGIVAFIRDLRDSRAAVASDSVIHAYSRQHGAATLAALLDRVSAETGHAA